jgi:hypothetical protein
MHVFKQVLRALPAEPDVLSPPNVSPFASTVSAAKQSALPTQLSARLLHDDEDMHGEIFVLKAVDTPLVRYDDDSACAVASP